MMVDLGLEGHVFLKDSNSLLYFKENNIDSSPILSLLLSTETKILIDLKKIGLIILGEL